MKLIELFEALSPGQIKTGSSRNTEILASINARKLEDFKNDLKFLEDILIKLDIIGLDPEISGLYKDFSVKFNKVAGVKIGMIEDSKSTSQINKIWAVLESQCSTIMNIYENINKGSDKNLVLLRGIKSADSRGKYFLHGKPFDTRKPTHSNKIGSQVIANIQKELGIKARRDNSVFCTSNRSFASQFGEVYIVFPKNNFPYTWSPKEDDVIINARYLSTKIDDSLFSEMKATMRVYFNTIDEHSEQYERIFKDKYGRFTLNNADKYDFINAIIDGDLLARARQIGDKFPPHLLELISILCISEKSYASHTDIKTSGIESAMESGNEVLISAEYYAMHYDMMPFLMNYLSNRNKV